ncbi:hypothetical protein [Candidatus Mycoplasma haematominutum]|uniref:hypothetical protein n=1 Tax=Candidatus Mycoplasma haematominutum TaxID=209446 RepID=UPI0005C6AB6B|nr:hypothetical protein [Candidatus Mycoplasma haematominutum]
MIQYLLPFLSGGGGTQPLTGKELDNLNYHQNLAFEGKQLSSLNIRMKEFKAQDIKEVREQILELNKSTQLETTNSAEKALGITSEIGRETQTLQIDKNSTDEVTTAKSKISSQLSNYKSALQKVQNYQSTTSMRKKRSTKKSSIPELTPQERKALSDFYKQFQELKQKKGNFLTRLQKVENSSEAISDSFKTDCESCKNVEAALQKINWEGPTLNIFTKNDRKWTGTSPIPQAESWKTLWGDWDKRENPYSHFWEVTNSESAKSSAKNRWISAVDKIFQNRKKYYQTVNSSSWRACGLTIGLFGADCGYSKKGSMEQEIKDSHSEIELTVAKALLTWMSQLS